MDLDLYKRRRFELVPIVVFKKRRFSICRDLVATEKRAAFVLILILTLEEAAIGIKLSFTNRAETEIKSVSSTAVTLTNTVSKTKKTVPSCGSNISTLGAIESFSRHAEKVQKRTRNKAAIRIP